MHDFRFQRRYQGKLQAVILDWAGTTVDFGCLAPVVVFVEVFRRGGVPITNEEAREPMGVHKKVHIRQISQLPSVAKRWKEVHGRPCTEDDIETMYRDFIPRQLDTVAGYADLIPGTLEAIDGFRKRGLKIGSTTGYTADLMDILVPEAKRRGYSPDCTVSASEVPAGRPEPWMCFANAQQMGVYPMEAIVKIGDTIPDIAEGLNAGMWAIGVTKTGNEIGLSESELAQLSEEQCALRVRRATDRLLQAGAHYVVDSISNVAACLDDIERRLGQGERP